MIRQGMKSSMGIQTGGKLEKTVEGDKELPVALGGKKRKASVKDRARAKKASRKAEREAGSDDEHLGEDVDLAADLDDPRFKVGSILCIQSVIFLYVLL
jgi:hypothetical protein